MHVSWVLENHTTPDLTGANPHDPTLLPQGALPTVPHMEMQTLVLQEVALRTSPQVRPWVCRVHGCARPSICVHR